jgi:hypothetical protein
MGTFKSFRRMVDSSGIMKTKLIIGLLLSVAAVASAQSSYQIPALPVLPVFPSQATAPGALPTFSAPTYRPVTFPAPAPAVPTYNRTVLPTGPVVNPPYLGQPYRAPVLPSTRLPVGRRY